MAKEKIILEVEFQGLDAANNKLDNLKATASDLRSQLKGMDEGSAAFTELNSELTKVTNSINALNDASGQIDLDAKFDDVYQNAAPLSTRLGELEDRMYELALAGQQNTAGFAALQQKAAHMRTTIIQVDASVDQLAENRGIGGLGAQFKDVGESLLNLDFTTAKNQADALAISAKAITFKGAAGSLKQLGGTFVTLGRTLLTNPLFLIPAVIAGLVIGLKELSDRVGFTKVVFERLTKTLKPVTDLLKAIDKGLKNLADRYLGTSNAAESAANKTAAASRKIADATQQTTDRVVSALDQQIRMAELNGQSTDDLARRRLIALKQVSKAELQATKDALTAAYVRKETDKELIKSLEEAVDVAKATLTERTNDITYFEAQITQRRKEAAAERRANDEAAKAEQKAKDEEFAQNRLATERQIQDLRLQNQQDGYFKEAAQLNLYYDRLIEDTKRDETKLQAERNAIVFEYEKLRQAELAKLRTEEKAKVEVNVKELDNILDGYIDGIIDAETAAVTAKSAVLENQIQKDAELTRKANEDAIKAAEERKNLFTQNLNNNVSIAASAFSAFSSLNDAFSKKNEAGAKKAFERNKKLQIAEATVNTIGGSIKAFMTAGNPIVGAIQAAIVTATGIAQIKKIKDTKYESPSISPSGSSSSGGGGFNSNAPAPAPIVPSLNLNTSQGGQVGGTTQNVGVRQTAPIMRAYVVESDIRETSNRLENYRLRSEIG